MRRRRCAGGRVRAPRPVVPLSPGTALQLIDGHLFCEVDKYARMAHPDVVGLSVPVAGELRRGIEGMRRRDVDTAEHLDRRLNGLLDQYTTRIEFFRSTAVWLTCGDG